MVINKRSIFLKAVKSIALPAGLYILFIILTRITGNYSFGVGAGLSQIFRQSSTSIFISMAFCLNLIGGRFDFSMGAGLLLASILGANVAVMTGTGLIGLLLFCIVFALLINLFTSIMYLLLRMPMMIVTIGLTLVYESITAIIFKGNGANLVGHQDMTLLGKSPYVYIIAAAGMILFYILMTYTRYGYHSNALANGQRIAVNIGIKPKRNVLITFLIIGISIGIAAAQYVSVQIVKPASGLSSTSVMFSGMIPVIIGMGLARYSNLSIGIFLGNLTMGILGAGLIAIGFNSTAQIIFSGLFLLVFVGFDMHGTELLKRIKEYRRLVKA